VFIPCSEISYVIKLNGSLISRAAWTAAKENERTIFYQNVRKPDLCWGEIFIGKTKQT